MEKIVEQGLLYDFYGDLLTEHQRAVYEDAVYNDMSLSELADAYEVSRQGIHDLLKRCDKILLGKFTKIKGLLHDMKETEQLSEIHRIADEILEEL